MERLYSAFCRNIRIVWIQGKQSKNIQLLYILALFIIVYRLNLIQRWVLDKTKSLPRTYWLHMALFCTLKACNVAMMLLKEKR